MLVSHTHRFIYIKTTKTASTSVELAFEPLCLPPGAAKVKPQKIGNVLAIRESEYGIVGARGRGSARDYKWWNHMPAEQIKAQLPAEIWDGYFKFCCVRNPWDKVVSAFHFLRQGQPELEPAARVAAFRDWLFNEDRAGVDRKLYTIDGKVVVDRFIRYERLAADIAEVCAHIGVPMPDLPWLKGGIRPAGMHYSEYYDQASRDHVAKLFAEDIAMLGYEFEDRPAA